MLTNALSAVGGAATKTLDDFLKIYGFSPLPPPPPGDQAAEAEIRYFAQTIGWYRQFMQTIWFDTPEKRAEWIKQFNGFIGNHLIGNYVWQQWEEKAAEPGVRLNVVLLPSPPPTVIGVL
jgi:hypothetical protein